jgi:hypothetical protein
VRAGAFCPARFFLPLRASLEIFNFYISQKEPQATYYTLAKSATSTTSRHCPTFTFLLLIFCLYVQALKFLTFIYLGKNLKRLITRSQNVPPRPPRDNTRLQLCSCTSFAFLLCACSLYPLPAVPWKILFVTLVRAQKKEGSMPSFFCT